MSSTDPTIRAFIAAMLPPTLRASLVELGNQFAHELGTANRALRWLRPEGLHLTLHFEGALPVGRVAGVQRAMEIAAARCAHMTFQATGLGAFPNTRSPRVIWARVTGELEQLTLLAQAIEREMSSQGFTTDKPFRPHLTLARVRESAGSDALSTLEETLSRWRDATPDPSQFRIEEITLVQSELTPHGSRYTSLATAALNGERS